MMTNAQTLRAFAVAFAIASVFNPLSFILFILAALYLPPAYAGAALLSAAAGLIVLELRSRPRPFYEDDLLSYILPLVIIGPVCLIGAVT
jgi:hypothetical protein